MTELELTFGDWDCPICSSHHNCVAGQGGPPKVEDVLICSACKAVHLVGEQGPRRATPRELADLAADPQLRDQILAMLDAGYVP